MPTILQKPMHRERTPARLCLGCKASWLSSANEDHFCYQCGGWTTQRLNGLEAIGEAHGPARKRERVGAALEELMVG